MANESLEYFPTTWRIYVITGCVDHIIGVPVNCWALWLIVSGKQRLIESEVLTLNLVIMEIACAVCFFLNVIQIYIVSFSVELLAYFYGTVAVVGRTLFQCHLCVDRYLAVAHPVVFIRYKHIRYRGACLAAAWLVILGPAVSNMFFKFNPTLVSICSFSLLSPALATELFCSLSILRILRKPGPGEAHKGKEGNRQKKRAFKIMCITLVMLVLNVLPFIIGPLLKGIPLGEMMPVAFTLATVGSSVQGLFFLCRSGKLPCVGKH